MSENYRIKLQEVVNVGGGITPTGTIEITQNGIVNVAPYAEANVQVPGSASGTITITENQQGLDISSYAAANIEVPQGVFPEGTLQISENGEKTVANYEKVDVNVPQGVFPAGTLEINQNGLVNVRNYENANVNIPGPTGTKDITENGDYDVSAFAGAHVAVPQGITPTGTINITQNGDTDVTNYATAHVAVPGGVTPTGSINIDENGTYNVTDKATAIINVPQYGKPTVPQNGTWQFKTTPTKGFIIIGKDDDTVDNAQFVRMVNGYGFPVVLNTESGYQSRNLDPDTDSAVSQYPSGSVAQFPNGVTVQGLNQYIAQNANLGEVSQHDNGDGQTWDSSKLTGDVLDTYYATYTSGGGLKSKSDFKDAIIEKYASTDIAQDASRVGSQRKTLQAAIEGYLYTIGKWGGHQNWSIDNISIGTSGACEVPTADWSRSQNYMGDGLLSVGSPDAQRDPWHIYRNSSGLDSSVIESMLTRAYENQLCVECFTHLHLTDASSWLDFKTTLDTITTWVNQGKIQVVTRKQYYQLGEFVEHPITSLVLSADAVSYEVNSTITASNFTCKAVLDNNTQVTCEADKILDLSSINTAVVGTYTATLKYRGLQTTCNVTIVNNTPSTYLLDNGTFSGESITANGDIGTLAESITYEANKTYKLEFDFSAATSVQYSTHNIKFKCGGYKANWVTSEEYTLSASEGTTSGHVALEFTTTAAQTVTAAVYVSARLNVTSIGAWSITNAYIYEVTE